MRALKKSRLDSDRVDFGKRSRVLRDTVGLLVLVLGLYHGGVPPNADAASADQAKREYFDFLFKNPNASPEQRKSSFERFRREGSDAQIQGARNDFVESRIARKRGKLKKSAAASPVPVPQASSSQAAPSKRSGPGVSSRNQAAAGSGATIDTSTMPDVLDFTTRPRANPSPSSQPLE